MASFSRTRIAFLLIAILPAIAQSVSVWEYGQQREIRRDREPFIIHSGDAAHSPAKPPVASQVQQSTRDNSSATPPDSSNADRRNVLSRENSALRRQIAQLTQQQTLAHLRGDNHEDIQPLRHSLTNLERQLTQCVQRNKFLANDLEISRRCQKARTFPLEAHSAITLGRWLKKVMESVKMTPDEMTRQGMVASMKQTNDRL